jgi:hypothetical protein
MIRPSLFRGFAALLVLSAPAVAHADPIRIAPIAVTASNSEPGYPPIAVLDGDSGTIWDAGSGTTQWIQLDLGTSLAVGKIRLQVAQNPAGATTHVVSAGSDPTQLRTIGTLSQVSSDGQWLELDGYDSTGDRFGDIRYIRVTTTSSPSWVAWKEIEVYGAAEYFGYYCDACAYVGSSGDYIEETTANGTNLVWIDVSDADTLTARFTETRRAGAKAMVALAQVLSQGRLNMAAYPALAAVIRANLDVVAAFYLEDEPYGGQGGVSQTAVTELTTLSNQLHSDFPGIPTASIQDTYSLGTVKSLTPAGQPASQYAMMDWVGFDCYDTFSNCSGNIETLRSLLGRNQRMIAVPWAFLPQGPLHDTSVASQAQLIGDNYSNWVKTVKSDARYVALIPFLWQGVPDGTGVNIIAPGVRDLVWPSGVRVLASWLQQIAATFVRPADNRVYPISATSPSSDGASYAFNAFDGRPDTVWNAGGFAPRSVYTYFDDVVHVARIELTTEQSPAGPTMHQIWGFKTVSSSWTLLGTLSGNTTDGQTLVWTGSADVGGIVVYTQQSPSWVAWREIKFYRQ